MLGFNIVWVVEIINGKCKTYYHPGFFISIDKTLIKFKGRYYWRQHIKMYALADSRGFIWCFWLYARQQESTDEIVLEMVDKVRTTYPHKQQKVYCDCYYRSWKLAQQLIEKSTQFVLVCQSNCPTWLFQCIAKGLKKGATQFLNWKNKCIAFCFKDKRPVCMLTNAHPSKIQQYTSKQNQQVRNKPVAIYDYNQHMHGVDKGDVYINKWLNKHRN
jgi:hypothetical protein